MVRRKASAPREAASLVRSIIYLHRDHKKLARLLRMLGHDARVGDRVPHPGQVLLEEEGATAPTPVRLDDPHPFHQARQLAARLGPGQSFTRCLEDNAALVPLPRADAKDRVPDRVWQRVTEFLRCPRCDRAYWHGRHVEGMQRLVEELTEAPVIHARLPVHEPAPGLGELSPLLDVHAAIEIWLKAHRLALMQANLPKARRDFRRFIAALERHMRDEERWVLPRYEEKPPAEGYARGASPAIFARDHTLLRNHLRRIDDRIDGLEKIPAEARAEACLSLLEDEHGLLGLLEHHDHREHEHLYPAVANTMSAGEKLQLLEDMLGPPDS